MALFFIFLLTAIMLVHRQSKQGKKPSRKFSSVFIADTFMFYKYEISSPSWELLKAFLTIWITPKQP